MNITRGRDGALRRPDAAARRPYHRITTCLFGLAMLLSTASIAIAQSEPEVRRARPVDEPPVRRAIPADESIDKVLRSLKDEVSEPSSGETEGADQRQLDYANGLFTRKLYDFGDPGISKISRRLPGTRWPSECLFLAWRMLSKPPSRFQCSYQSAESAHRLRRQRIRGTSGIRTRGDGVHR